MKGANHYMNIEEQWEERGVSSPKTAIRLAYLRTLVEEGILPTSHQKPVKTVSTPIEESGRERIRKKKRRVKWGKRGRW